MAFAPLSHQLIINSPFKLWPIKSENQSGRSVETSGCFAWGTQLITHSASVMNSSSRTNIAFPFSANVLLFAWI